MPRDPLAPVFHAADELDAAKTAVDVAEDEAAALIKAARDRHRSARVALHARIVEAAERGVRQVDLVRASGMTREAVRRILRAGGITAD